MPLLTIKLDPTQCNLCKTYGTVIFAQAGIQRWASKIYLLNMVNFNIP